jgi:hypothetical protein
MDIVKYSIMARNWLYSAHRQDSIISGLECDGWQDSARENLVFKISYWAEQTVLLVFLKNYLQMKAKTEQRIFYATIRLFLQRQNDNTLNQLTPTPPFPTPHILAQFAYK